MSRWRLSIGLNSSDRIRELVGGVCLCKKGKARNPINKGGAVWSFRNLGGHRCPLVSNWHPGG